VKVTVFGAGYVGLVTGACLAEMGNHVLLVDVDASKIDLLNSGGVPIHEPGLDMLIQRNCKGGRLSFGTDLNAAVAHGVLQFIAVGTPPDQDGTAYMGFVHAAARGIGERMTEYKVVVTKSTVPVGTAEQVRCTLQAALAARGRPDLAFSVSSNPEFLKQGSAVQDFMRPDRVVLGIEPRDGRAEMLLRALYAPYVRNRDRLHVMSLRSAEFTKYAANAMLATRISFMNELSRLAEALDVDIEAVRTGIGSDPRIGTHFLYAGAGYGGSCFPKDVKALKRSFDQAGIPSTLLGAVEDVNEQQKQVLVRKITAHFGENLKGKTFALWGLAFKPNTDDMREAPSRTLIAGLVKRGARVQAYDPEAVREARRVLMQDLGEAAAMEQVEFVDNAHRALHGANALVVITEWKEFRTPDFDTLVSTLSDKVVFDGRNLYDPRLVASFGLTYRCIGRGSDSGRPLVPLMAERAMA
jgi:UDPglucose 6-dehydrogenase